MFLYHAIYLLTKNNNNLIQKSVIKMSLRFSYVFCHAYNFVYNEISNYLFFYG